MAEKFQIFLRYRHYRARLRPGHICRRVRASSRLRNLFDRLKCFLKAFKAVVADVDSNLTGRSHCVCNRSALNHTYIHKKSMFKVMKLLDLDDLMRHLQNRVSSALRIISSVGRDSVNGECHTAGTFSSNNESVIDKSRLKVECRRASRAEFPDL